MQHQFEAVPECVNELHEVIDTWRENQNLQRILEPEDFERMRLAIHEWIANLVQHASFDTNSPELNLTLEVKDGRVKCTIADNSEGFDLHSETEIRTQALADTILPERGMGLPIIMACTNDLRYYSANGRYNYIEFYISSEDDPWLNLPF